ncbi:MAG: flavin reductase family protein [Bryobacteraceae bacterium]
MHPREFRSACSRFATGVTIVVREHDGVRRGVTVSAFTSVSLDPPLVLVCIHQRSSFLARLEHGGGLVINVLAADQADLAERFATKPPAERFLSADWDGLELRGAAAVLECRVHSIEAAGDHAMILCRVGDAFTADREPLVYWRSAFHGLSAPDDFEALAVAA